MVSDTLLIRHLPASLTAKEIEDFLKHIGAIRVFIRESKIKKYSYAFAKFENERVAGEVVSRIHQKELLGSRLIVEFANDQSLNAVKGDDVDEYGAREKKMNDEDKKTKMRETFVRNLNNWTAGLNFALPPPYHLKYRYRLPDPSTLLNIVNMLSFNVKFYTQVLHLMNKMNLPCPFDSTYSPNENDVFNSFIAYVVENCSSTTGNGEKKTDEISKEDEEEKDGENEEDEEEEDDESELESDDQQSTAAYSSSAVSIKRKSAPPPVQKSTKKRRPLILKSTVAASSKTDKTSIDDVFEKVERDKYAKKIEVKINTANVAIPRHSEANSSDEKDQQRLPNIENEQEPKSSCQTTENISAPDGCITDEELASNRIPERDWQMLPFFKNYRPGAPCNRLYIKNLSKHVTVSDLNYIFTRYSVQTCNELETKFDIRLMQEGRMKGQAFVTLANVELAALALKETNGYIVKGKPMVVQFAKAPVTEDKRCD